MTRGEFQTTTGAVTPYVQCPAVTITVGDTSVPVQRLAAPLGPVSRSATTYGCPFPSG